MFMPSAERDIHFEIGNSQKEEILTKEINNIFDRAEQMGLQTR